MTSSLFVTDADTYVPTGLTRTGWNDHTQHGGPPTALLMREIEALPTLAPMQVVRFTMDLLRPVPLERLRTSVRVTREGKNVQWSEAVLCAGEMEIARLHALRIRTADVDLPDLPAEAAPLRVPDAPDVWRSDWSGDDPGVVRFHRDAVEVISPTNAFLSAGPGVALARLLVPVVDEERPSDLVRLAALADLANGVSSQLDYDHYLFINADITVAINRTSTDEWIGFDGQSHPSRSGVGMADTRIFDGSGVFGRILQAQLIDRRT